LELLEERIEEIPAHTVDDLEEIEREQMKELL